MKPAASMLTQIDELPGEEIEFGIGDPRWVMRTQARLYSDVTTAIIREYSTNAYDAHVEAGNTAPIEVTLPSMMNNNCFVVRDKGVGMDLSIFKKIYTQFGVSPKRTDSTTNGMLGYGSKSGVAYTTAFSVTSVRNGCKIEGVIQRRPDWSIVLKVVSQTKTDEPNGTTITIPVHNVDEFNHKAKEFYKFWLPGRVLVNGVEPQHAVGEKITDNFYYSTQWNTSYVVMGNVAYRIANPDALFRNSKMSRVNFVAYVDDFKTDDGVQAVEFTPSREDLEYTEHTKNTLQSVINSFEQQIVAKAKADIDSAANHAEAFKAWKHWTDTLGKAMFEALTFKGDAFEPQFKINGYRYYKNSYTNSVQSIQSWGVEQMDNTMVVTEFGINMSSNAKAKAREFAKLKGWNVNYILFTAATKNGVVSKWISKDRFVTWEALKAAVPVAPKTHNGVNNNPNTGRVKGSWDYYTSNGFETQKPLPSTTTDLFYISVHYAKNWSVPALMESLNMRANAAVLVVPANRLPKLLRENPKIKEFTSHAKRQVVLDGGTLLCDKGKEVKNLSLNTRRWLSNMDVARLDDPRLAYYTDLIAREDELTKRYDDNLSLAQECKMRYTIKEYRSTDENYVTNTYPLLAGMSYYSIHNDVYVYMNAKFASESEKKNG